MITSAGFTTSATEYARRLEEYKETISRLFPMVPQDAIDAWSVSESDILALGLLLDCYPQEVAVLDIRTFVGASAFFFARHPKVTRVVSVDPNPTLADDINDNSEMLGVQIDPKPLRNLKVLDVARAVLAEFPDENRKVQLHAGTVGTKRIGIAGDSSRGPESLETPMLDLSGEKSLLAFVDGLHTREGVQADLETVFEHNPRAVAILDDCRHTWGPFVQAGIVSFMEGAQLEYDFRLIGDLGPGVATSNLGMVYPRVDGAEVQRTLTKFAELFTERLDLLRLLRREEELIATVNRYKEAANEAAKLQERNARLEEDNIAHRERNSELGEHNSELAERNSEAGEHNTRLKEQKGRLEEQNYQLVERVSQLKEHISKVRERLSEVRERSTAFEQQISQLEQRNARLEEENIAQRKRNSELSQELGQETSQLAVYRSSRRYKIADAVAERLRWVPGASRRAPHRPEQ